MLDSGVLLSGSVALGVSLILIYFAYFWLMSRSLKQGVSWRYEKLEAKVSLIIATYNEEATLPRKLRNVLEQDYPKELLELVIIDSGSTDRSFKIAEEFIEQNPNIKVVLIREEERLGKSHAVNIAYSKASGQIKIISDADVLLEKSAITRIVSNFSDPRIGAASGGQCLLNAERNTSTMLEKHYKGVYEVLRKGESYLDSTPIFDGALAAYRASLIEPLPENKSADDTRLANIIRRKGYRVVYDSTAVFYEYAPTNLSAKFTQKVRRGQGLIRVFWDFKGNMFKRKYGKYGQLILPMEFFMHCVFPTFWLIFLITFFSGLALFSPALLLLSLIGLATVLVVIKTLKSYRAADRLRAVLILALSFVTSQLFLLCASILCLSGRSLHVWQKVDDVREEWKAEERPSIVEGNHKLSL